MFNRGVNDEYYPPLDVGNFLHFEEIILRFIFFSGSTIGFYSGVLFLLLCPSSSLLEHSTG